MAEGSLLTAFAYESGATQKQVRADLFPTNPPEVIPAPLTSR
jgi:hypothetical protein